MKLTKKHFIKIASIISDNRYTDNIALIDDLSDYFKSEINKFDAIKFKEACLK